MKLLISCVLLCWIATKSLAAPVVVRTGEHENFTRAVLFLPQGSEWSMGRDAQGYVIRTSVPDGFQLDVFFDLIPRTRITDVAQRIETGELFLSVDCNCHAKASVMNETILVIDVLDGPAGRISSFELGLPALTLPIDQNTAVLVGEQTANHNDRLLPLVPNQPQDTDVAVAIDPPVPIPTQDDTLVTRQGIISDFENEVLQALGQGLSGRLLQERLPDRAPAPAPVSGADFADVGNLPGVNARTSVDPLAIRPADDAPQTQSGTRCLPDLFFDVKSWGDDRPFGTQIGEARIGVFQEFDSTDETAITKLAQTFVFFGFGKEALQTLELDQVQSQQRLYLAALARIIDDEEPVEAGFDGQVSCASLVALWALLANDVEITDAKVERDSILRAFKELPAGLQTIIGPSLSRSFLRIGDLEASQQVLNRSQSGVVDVSAVAIAESELTKALRGPEAADDILSAVVDNSARTSPALLTRYFEEKLASGAEFSEDDFTLADALRFEARGAENYAALVAAQIRGHLVSDEFIRARNLLDSEASLLSETVQGELENELATQAVARMPDATFGQFVWSQQLFPMTPTLITQFATRLDAMGFPDQAREMRANLGPDDAPVAASSRAFETDLADISTGRVPLNGVATVDPDGGASTNANFNSFEGVTLQGSRSTLQASRDRRASFERQLEAIMIPES